MDSARRPAAFAAYTNGPRRRRPPPRPSKAKAAAVLRLPLRQIAGQLVAPPLLMRPHGRSTRKWRSFPRPEGGLRASPSPGTEIQPRDVVARHAKMHIDPDR